LYKNRLIDPISLDNGLTYLWGKDSDMLTLMSLTSGQKGGMVSVAPKVLNDSQYTWNVMGRMKHTSKVVGLANGSNTKPGLQGSTFEVDFEDDWFKRFYSITSPDKNFTCRIQGNATRLASNKYRVRLILLTGNSSEYVTLDNFLAGKSWVMGAPSVAASRSDGTVSNSMSPGKWTNQFGLYRFGKQISGNVANKVVNIEFDTLSEDGSKGTTNMWMPFEMKLFEIDRKILLEEELWNSRYNRDANGVIFNKDEQTGEPLPRGAGVKDILYTTGQYETYGKLTLSKLDSMINRIYSNRVDDTPMELVLIGGKGAAREFNRAIKEDARGNSYYESLGAEEVMSGKDGFLSYGKYFNQYKTIDGHIITFKPSKTFDVGLYAELDRANGNMHDGLPHTSYDLFLLDFSMTNSGERNIELVAEKGREIHTGVYKGMTPLPESWGAIGSDKLLSSKIDEASYEVMVSQGINMRNYTTSYWMKFVA
jgi:hypothetical protein